MKYKNRITIKKIKMCENLHLTHMHQDQGSHIFASWIQGRSQEAQRPSTLKSGPREPLDL